LSFFVNSLYFGPDKKIKPMSWITIVSQTDARVYSVDNSGQPNQTPVFQILEPVVPSDEAVSRARSDSLRITRDWRYFATRIDVPQLKSIMKRDLRLQTNIRMSLGYASHEIALAAREQLDRQLQDVAVPEHEVRCPCAGQAAPQPAASKTTRRSADDGRIRAAYLGLRGVNADAGSRPLGRPCRRDLDCPAEPEPDPHPSVVGASAAGSDRRSKSSVHLRLRHPEGDPGHPVLWADGGMRGGGEDEHRPREAEGERAAHVPPSVGSFVLALDPRPGNL
jgi:hypothetical protein